MTYQEFFEQIKEKFMRADVSSVTEHLAFQFKMCIRDRAGRKRI